MGRNTLHLRGVPVPPGAEDTSSLLKSPSQISRPDPHGLDGAESSIPGFTKPQAGGSTLVGKIGNFSVQYNLGAASIALSFMQSRDDHVLGSDSGSKADFPEPGWVKYTLLGMVFAGAVVGMLFLGRLGDPEMLGRHKALVLTLSFVVIGSLGSAVAPWGSMDCIYAIICGFRFLVGVGVGGIYPLSASHSAEAHEKEEGGEDIFTLAPEEEERLERRLRAETAGHVGWAFFWQVPGQMSPYVVALILLGIHEAVGPSFSVACQWRILLGLGAVPAGVVMLLTIRELREATDPDLPGGGLPVERSTTSVWHTARRSPAWPEIRLALIGACGTWFLYDIAFYGTNTFLPYILENIFGSGDTLAAICWQSIVSIAIGIPGVIIGIKVQQWKESRFNNLWGFVVISVLFFLLAVTYAVREDGHMLLFTVFLFLNCSLNAGPSVATYVNPAIIFPVEIRSAAHGMASASAKLGAVVGTFMYPPMSESLGFAPVMLLQACFSLMGAFWAWRFCPATDKEISLCGEQTLELDETIV
eukprot:Hpha_TRINITY_DN15029_c5_g5::TRINITY_DN15029_c5_g5_i2::g.125575::m.125575/K08176/PHO84; MFS transporter, PHS family, inorganic phosphate transporter